MQKKAKSVKKPNKDKQPNKQKVVTKTRSIHSANKNAKKKNKGLIVGIIAVLSALIIITLVLLFVFKKDSDINTAKIMTKLSDKISAVTDVINYSEANDPNGIMGQENQYSSKSSWEDSRLPEHTSEFAGTIEVFNNTKDAELREWKINKTLEVCNSRVTQEKYGSAVMAGWTCNDYHMIRKNTVIIRLSSDFTAEQISEYENALAKIIDGFIIPDSNVPSIERINELRKETEENLDSVIDEQEKELQEGLDEILSSYESTLDAIAESLNEDELADAKETLNFFKEASYFAPKIAGLEQKIKIIENKIEENKKQAADAAAKAEQERLASKNRTLGSGKYSVCTDIDPGTYDVTAISGSGNLYVSGSNNLNHYVNELMDANGSYGWIQEYKNMALSCSDVLEIKNGLTVKITAKR